MSLILFSESEGYIKKDMAKKEKHCIKCGEEMAIIGKESYYCYDCGIQANKRHYYRISEKGQLNKII